MCPIQIYSQTCYSFYVPLEIHSSQLAEAIQYTCMVRHIPTHGPGTHTHMGQLSMQRYMYTGCPYSGYAYGLATSRVGYGLPMHIRISWSSPAIRVWVCRIPVWDGSHGTLVVSYCIFDLYNTCHIQPKTTLYYQYTQLAGQASVNKTLLRYFYTYSYSHLLSPYRTVILNEKARMIAKRPLRIPPYIVMHEQ